jgi:chemotaxis receptor (MCP) glutamine deamidase CheD
MTAGGNEEKVKKAKTTVINLIIGLCLTIIVYALASYLGGLISRMLLAF